MYQEKNTFDSIMASLGTAFFEKNKTQSEILEQCDLNKNTLGLAKSRKDIKLSTLRMIVEALGYELEVRIIKSNEEDIKNVKF